MQPRLARDIAWLAMPILAAGLIGCDRGPAKKEAPSHSEAKALVGAAVPAKGEGNPTAAGVKLASIPTGDGLGDVAFGAGGRPVAFVAKRDGKAVVYVDGRPGKTYEEARLPVFQEDGSGFAFLAKQGGAEFVVVDGVEGTRYDSIGSMRFSPGGVIVYTAVRNGEWRVVAGSRESPVAGATEPPFFRGADGKRLFYVEQRADKGTSRLRACSLAMTECTSGPDHARISLVTVDAAGALLAYVVTGEAGQAVATVALDQRALKERVGRWYQSVSIIGISRGGGHLAFIAGKDGGEVLVRDGDELPFPGFASPFVLAVSVTGRTLLTGLSNGRLVAYVDAQKLAGDYEEINFPVFSADGSRWAFVATRNSKDALVLDGRESPFYDKIVDPRFTPDGAKVACRARNDGERFVVVSDGSASGIRQLRRYQAVFEVMFQADGKAISHGASSGQEIWWVTEAI